MTKKHWIMAALAAAVITGGYFFMGDSTPKTTYLTETVQRGDIEKNVVATGSIESVNTVDVGAQVSGKVTKLYVALGQQVKKGDMIAEIDSTTQINTLNTRKAALASYQAQFVARKTAYDVALSNYHRLTKLYAQKGTSLDSLNSAKATLDNAKIESVDPATTMISNSATSSTTSSTSSTSNSAVYYYANIIVENPNRILRIGMTTENNIKIANVQNVLSVPNMAIQTQNGKTFVKVLNSNNQPEQREVEIGVQNDYQTEIKSGVAEGEKVIVSQVAAGEAVGSMRGPRIF